MRVVAFTPLYPPQSRVGAWLATHQYLRHLVTRDHEVTAFSLEGRVRGHELDGVTVESVLRGRTRAFELAATADVVVSHCGDGGTGVELATGKPSVRMAHGPNASGVDADLVVFNSHALRDATPHSGPSIVCHPPTDPADYRTTRGDHVTIVNCSELKGIKTAWRCADALPRRRFLGVRGGYGNQLVPRSPNFEVIDPQPDMRAVYSRTRVLLMPSEHETWGMVGIEAMCSGIPVIAHPTPGLRESLGDAGIFVDRNDTAGWTEQIERLDDPDEYAEASEAALKRVAEFDPQGDLERFATAVEALCRTSH